jgi:hypothetical protein
MAVVFRAVLSQRLATTKLENGFALGLRSRLNDAPPRLLELIGMAGVDGDSYAQLVIHKITVEQLFTVLSNSLLC